MVEAFMSQVAGNLGSLHGGGRTPPSNPQVTGGGGGGGDGGRPEVPLQESQCGAPPHLVVFSEPGQSFSQQHDRMSPRPRGLEHTAGACAAVRLLSQLQAVHLDSPQQAASHAL